MRPRASDRLRFDLREVNGALGDLGTLLPLTIGVVSLALFVGRQLKLVQKGRALLDLRTFAVGSFRLAVGLMGGFMLTLFGALILLPLYLQNVLGLDTLPKK